MLSRSTSQAGIFVQLNLLLSCLDKPSIFNETICSLWVLCTLFFLNCLKMYQVSRTRPDALYCQGVGDGFTCFEMSCHSAATECCPTCCCTYRNRFPWCIIMETLHTIRSLQSIRSFTWPQDDQRFYFQKQIRPTEFPKVSHWNVLISLCLSLCQRGPAPLLRAIFYWLLIFFHQEKLAKSIHYLISKEDQVRSQITNLEVLINQTEVRLLTLGGSTCYAGPNEKQSNTLYTSLPSIV